LPEARHRQIQEDLIDLAVTMRGIIREFYKSNQNAPNEKLHKTFLLGTQSWGS